MQTKEYQNVSHFCIGSIKTLNKLNFCNLLLCSSEFEIINVNYEVDGDCW